jgi:hypothetical protein
MPLIEASPFSPTKAVPKELFVDDSGGAYYRKTNGDVVTVGGLGTNKIQVSSGLLKLASVNIVEGNFTLTMPNTAANDGIMIIYKRVTDNVILNVNNQLTDLIILRDEEGITVASDISLDYNADVILFITKIGTSYFVKTM